MTVTDITQQITARNGTAVTIYKTPTCRTCPGVIRMIQARGYDPEVVDITTDAAVDTPCRQAPEAWFPPPGGSAPVARALYQTCPAIGPCLDAALDFEGTTSRVARFGIWGRMTPQQCANETQLRAAETWAEAA